MLRAIVDLSGAMFCAGVRALCRTLDRRSGDAFHFSWRVGRFAFALFATAGLAARHGLSF